MATLKQLLIEWNGGIERGAQVRLSREIKAAETTISKWLTGQLTPSELKKRKLSEIFKVSLQDIEKAISNVSARNKLIDIFAGGAAKAQLEKQMQEIILVKFTKFQWEVLKEVVRNNSSVILAQSDQGHQESVGDVEEIEGPSFPTPSSKPRQGKPKGNHGKSANG